MMMKVGSSLLLLLWSLPVAFSTPVVVVQATQATPLCVTGGTTAFVHGSNTAAAATMTTTASASSILSSSTLTSSTAAVFTTIPRGGGVDDDSGEGGRLHHPETIQDVEALILNASLKNQLVVIDFTASWYVLTATNIHRWTHG